MRSDAKVVEGGDDDGAEFDVTREIDDDDLLFSPSRGNVCFACALEGWAFRLNDFAKLYSKKLRCNEASLLRALWGPYTYSSKAKKVTKIKADEGNKKPMFVQLVLDPIWQSYAILDESEGHAAAVVGGVLPEMMALKMNSMDLAIPNHPTPAMIQHKMWRPIPPAQMLMRP